MVLWELQRVTWVEHPLGKRFKLRCFEAGYKGTYLEGVYRGEKGVKSNMRRKRREQNMRSGNVRGNASPCLCGRMNEMRGCSLSIFEARDFVDLT